MAYTSGSPGAGQLEIGIALVLHDRFSNQAREASSQIKKLHMDAKNAINANLQAIQGISQSGANIARAAGAQISRAITDGAQFIDTMVTVKAITAATDKEFTSLQDSAQSLGIRTMFDSREIASGMKYLAMAGTSAKDITNVIEGAAMVANATGLELGGKGGAADMLTNVMRMFKIEASEAASVVGDQLTKAALSANMSMTDMAESIKYAGADMVTLRQSLPSVAAMIGTLGNAGIQGSMAGTAISNMARYLNKSISQPGFKGAKALANIGLGKQDFIDAKGDLVDISIILGKINNATQNLTSTEKNAVLLDIFGVRGNRAAVSISRDLDGYRDLLGKITTESTGFAGDVVQQRMASLAGSMDIMTSAFENFRTTFAKSLEPILSPLFRGLGLIIDTVRQIFNIPILGPLISTAAVVGTVLLGIVSTITILRVKWLLFKNDSQVTSTNWFAILKGGWSGATLNAQRYLAIQTAILAQQKGGIGGNPMFSTMASNPGQWVGNAKATINKGGKTIYWVRDAAGGVKRATAEAAGKVVGGAAGAASSLVGGISRASTGSFNAAAGAAAAGTIAANVAKGAATKTVLTGLLGVGRGIMGFLGGPVGLAITAGTFLIPWLIGKLSDNSVSSKENTDATKDLTTTTKRDLLQRLSDSKNSEKERLNEEMRNLASIIQYWGMKMAGDNTKPINVHSNINLDGKPIVQLVQQAMAEKQTQEGYSLNAR